MSAWLGNRLFLVSDYFKIDVARMKRCAKSGVGLCHLLHLKTIGVYTSTGASFHAAWELP
jgi:hypothetical protein